jgi:hypothetical protein
MDVLIHVLDDGWTGDDYPRSWQLMNLQQFGPVAMPTNLPLPTATPAA